MAALLLHFALPQRSPVDDLTFCPKDLHTLSNPFVESSRFCRNNASSSSRLPVRATVGVSSRASSRVRVSSAIFVASLTETDEAAGCILEEEEQNHPFRIVKVETGGRQAWHSANVTKVGNLAPGVRSIIVQAECSREFVSLENAYTKPGQLAQVKVNKREAVVVVASSPFPLETNEPVLYKLRGDIPAGTTKQPLFFLSVRAPLQLHVLNTDTPDVFNLKEGDELEVGPFQATGLDLRPVMFISRYPTLLFFASGRGIAVAKAIIEARDANVGSLNLGLREDIRLYYSSPKPSFIAYKELFDNWEEMKVKVRAVVASTAGEEWNGYVGSLTTLWNEDDIEYDPMTTGVVVCVERAARMELETLLADAGIPETQIVTWEI